jgi:5,10-methylene-tetrahydrofolate dehydrogenase/methenyl tetrahydrofolate cyclohydrolase
MADTPAQAALIDGSAIASNIRAEIGAQVAAMKEKHGKARRMQRNATHQLAALTLPDLRRPQVPGLAVVIVGDRKDSATYVRMKKKACADAGIASFDCDLPGDATQADVLAAVAGFNANPEVHGILVQLPVRCARVCACVCVRLRSALRACVCACVRACACALGRSWRCRRAAR